MINPEVAKQINEEVQKALKANLEQHNKALLNSFVNIVKSQYYKSAIKFDKKTN